MSDKPEEQRGEDRRRPAGDEEPEQQSERTEVDERMDRVYPNRNMTAEERPEVPESGIEPSPETEPEPTSRRAPTPTQQAPEQKPK